MTAPSRWRVLTAAIVSLIPPALRENVEGDDPKDGEIEATKRAVLERPDAFDTDHYTPRLALEELHDIGRVRPAAVFWRPDRCEGDRPPVDGVNEAGDGKDG